MNVTFVFVCCYGTAMLLANANNENTPKSTLVDAVVPYVVCALRFYSSFFSHDSHKCADRRSLFSWGFDLLDIVKDCVSKLLDYGLLHELMLYVSIWNPDLLLLDLLRELSNELTVDWFIDREVGDLDSCGFSPSETDMRMSLLA